jgi:peptidyl-prolyl cis-trans isomerase D
MLVAIRQHAASFVVKVLFLVLVLSFVVWGIADVFTPGQRAQWVARVGDVTIGPDAYARAYQQTVQRLSSAFGQPIDAEQAQMLGLGRRVVEQMIGQALIDQAVADLGLVVGDDAVRATITADPRFRGAQGAFDAELFRRALANNGLTEDAYVALLRAEIARNQLIGGITALPGVPQQAVSLVYHFENEARTVRYAFLPTASMTTIPAADEAALRTFYQENPERFTAPERRAVTAIVLSAAELAKAIAVSDDEIRAAYDERADEFLIEERRSFRQMVLASQEAAEKASQSLAQGADFAAVAAELAGGAGGETRLSDLTRDELPPALADAVFAREPGKVGGPVQTPLGWHLVLVTAVTPATRTALAEVAPALRDEIAHERAIDQLIALGERLEDSLGGGLGLEQAAEKLGVPLRWIPALDAAGTDGQGKPIADLPKRFIDTAFAQPGTGQSRLIEADSETTFVVRVDSVTPAALKAFEDVRAEILAAWQADQRLKAAKAGADRIAETVRGGKPFADAAQAAGLKLERLGPLSRRDIAAAERLPRAFLEPLFAARRGEVFVVPAADGFYVGEVEAIEPAGRDPQAMAEVQRRLDQAMRGDLLVQYLSSLRRRYPVEINEAALRQGG